MMSSTTGIIGMLHVVTTLLTSLSSSFQPHWPQCHDINLHNIVFIFHSLHANPYAILSSIASPLGLCWCWQHEDRVEKVEATSTSLFKTEEEVDDDDDGDEEGGSGIEGGSDEQMDEDSEDNDNVDDDEESESEEEESDDDDYEDEVDGTS